MPNTKIRQTFPPNQDYAVWHVRLILIDGSKMMGHDDGSKQHNIWMQKNDTIIDCFICLFVYGLPTTSGTVRNSAQR